MDRVVNVAIVGATGLVGEAILNFIANRAFPVGELHLLASERSAGNTMEFSDRHLKVRVLRDFDFSAVDVAFFAVDADVSLEFAPIAADAGCLVIDCSSAFRLEPDVPLVVPEVNPESIADYGMRNMISCPGSQVIQVLTALAPIHNEVGLDRVSLSTYQPVSSVGKQGVEALAKQTANLLNAREIDPQCFTKQIAFNVIPQMGDVLENGYTLEEMRIQWEIQKVLQDDAVSVDATCVTVPVFFGTSVSLCAETKAYISADETKSLLAQAEGIDLLNDSGESDFATPVTEAAGQDAVFVSRIREDLGERQAISLWLSTDNIRKGAALNAVQVAEIALKNYI